MKIIFDTNIWISFFISKSFNKLKFFLMDDSTEIIFSTELLDELREVITRAKFRKIINNEALDEIINLIISRCKFYESSKRIILCRDPNDNFLLSLADISCADFLVTGDYDLLDLRKFNKTMIIKWSDFINRFD